MIPVAELELQDADGNIYPLEWPGRHTMEVSGLGMPPIRHWTTRSPFQHGRTHWGFAFQPRIINLVLYTRGGCRQGMWDRRLETCGILSPLPGALILRLTYPDGNAFELHDVWYSGGYDLSSADQRADGVQIGGVQLECLDPIWKWVTSSLDAGESRDAYGRTCVATSTFTLSPQLVLPFTFPFVMGTVVGTAALTCTNDGTWDVAPYITITGPTDDWVLTNTTTGAVIYWNGYPILAGSSVILDLKARTVTDGAGNDLADYASGDLATFLLEPGANALTFWSGGGAVNAVTTVAVCWYLEMVGV